MAGPKGGQTGGVTPLSILPLCRYESTSSEEEEEGNSSFEKASADSSNSSEQGDTETSEEEAGEGTCEPRLECKGTDGTLLEPPEVKEK